MGKKIPNVPWEEIQLAYRNGRGSCRELAEKYGVSVVAVQRRCTREGWLKEQQQIVQKVSEKVVERLVDRKVKQIEAHHSLVVPIAEKLIRGVEKSYAWAENTDTGVEASVLQGYAMALKTANAVGLLNLGFVEQKAVDVTSGGLSLHENALSILQSCRRLVEDGKITRESIDVKALVNEMKGEEAKENQ